MDHIIDKLLSILKIFLFLLLLTPNLIRGSTEKDRITALPGTQFHIQFNQFSGYLQGGNKTLLHYWFIESQHDNKTDPVVVWFNGGPGCSSLIGLMTENGPYRIEAQTLQIYEHVYSWNKVANVLYLESPAGVGFSYKADGGISTSDNETSYHNYEALLDFFLNKFPEYQNQSLWLAGEGYGGVFVATLAERIVKNAKFPAKLKGVAIGNGMLDAKKVDNSYIQYLYYHGIYGQKLWDGMSNDCCNQSLYCDYAQYFRLNDTSHITNPVEALCVNLTKTAAESIMGLDPFNLYFSCYERSNILLDSRVFAKASDDSLVRYAHLGANTIVKAVRDSLSDPRYPHCHSPLDNTTAMYLNQKEVQDAIHITEGTVDSWTSCNWKLSNSSYYHYDYKNMHEQFMLLIKQKVKILVYNGDVDAVGNFMGDQWFITNLNLSTVDERKAWHFEQDIVKVAGYVKRYQGVDLLTVRGAGHFVPQYKPREALQMFANFLWGRDYSTDTKIPVTHAPRTTPTTTSTSNVTVSTTQRTPCPKCGATEKVAAAAFGVLFGITLVTSLALGFCLYRATRIRI